MKAWKKLLAMLLCLVMLLSLAACGDDSSSDDDDDDDKPKETEAQLEEGDKDCAHVWKDWVVMKESTCTKSGSQLRTCDLCGREEEEKLSYTGHMYVDGKCEYCEKTQRACEHEKTKTILVEQQTCEKDGRENEVCVDCYAITNVEVLYATGHSYVYHEYQDPTCTEVGWYSYNTCENCDYSEFLDNKQEALGHSYVAGVCTVCEEKKEGFEIIAAPVPVENPFTVSASGEKMSLDVAEMDFISFTGNISERGQTDAHEFTVDKDGEYILVYNAERVRVDMKIYDSALQIVGEMSYCCNDDCVTLSLVAGEIYTLEAAYDWYTGDYQFSLAPKRENVDVSGYGIVRDKLQFADQVNYYNFTPSRSGSYSFVIDGMEAACRMELTVLKDDAVVKYYSYMSNGNSLIVDDMVAGETYVIEIQRDTTAYSAYSLSINEPSEVVDLTGYSSVTDTITFNGQTNIYTYTAPYDGTYRFSMSGMNDDAEVILQAFNPEGELLKMNSYAENYDSLTVENMQAGQTYTIKVSYRYDGTPYTVNISTPSAPIEMKNDMAVTDQIDYNGQYKTYIFNVEEAGNYRVSISGMDYYATVHMVIFDADGNEIDYDSSIYNNDGLTIFEASAGSSYTIRVYETYYLPTYTISIQPAGE